MRRIKAIRSLKDLKAAAKDIGKLRQSNEALKAEIDKLRERAADEAKRLQLQLLEESERKAAEAKEAEIVKMNANLSLVQAHLDEQIARKDNVEKLLALAEAKAERFESALNSAETKIEILEADLLSAKVHISLLEGQVSQSSESSQKDAAGTVVTTLLKPDRFVPPDDIDSQRAIAVSPRDPLRQASLHAEDANNLIPGDYQELLAVLAAERKAKSHFEREVGRLQSISLDLTSQIDSLRRASSTLGANAADKEVKRRPSSVSVSRRSRTAESKSLEFASANTWDDDEDEDDEVMSQESSLTPPPAKLQAGHTSSINGLNGAPSGVGKYEKSLEVLKTKLRLVRPRLSYFVLDSPYGSDLFV